MEKLFVGISVSLCLIVIVLHTITLYEPEPYRMKVYDCVIAETSEGENYPIEVKEECRKLKGRMI